MRKIILFDVITLDGFFEGPEREIDWHQVDDEFNEFAIEQLQEFNLLIFGRITYELMANYWPTTAALADDPNIAKTMNSIPKIVFSRALAKADWNNTTLVKEFRAEDVLSLKQQAGKDIGIFGSSHLAVSFMKNNLIDEYRILINPLILGRGRTLFHGIDQRMNFQLLRTKVFHNGNVLLSYKPV